MEEIIRRQLAFIEAGIVPFKIYLNEDFGLFTYDDVNQYLTSLPPDEARKMRRKFRKLWRKEVMPIAKKNTPAGRFAKKMFGAVRGHTPNKKQKLARKSVVLRCIDNLAKGPPTEDKI